MMSPSSPPNRVWFGFGLRDLDLLHLARVVFTVAAARQITDRLGLEVIEEADRDDREFAVLVLTPQLASAIEECTAAGITPSVVDASDAEAVALCQRYGLEAEGMEPDDPTA
jgi:hypothetical protein